MGRCEFAGTRKLGRSRSCVDDEGCTEISASLGLEPFDEPHHEYAAQSFVIYLEVRAAHAVSVLRACLTCRAEKQVARQPETMAGDARNIKMISERGGRAAGRRLPSDLHGGLGRIIDRPPHNVCRVRSNKIRGDLTNRREEFPKSKLSTAGSYYFGSPLRRWVPEDFSQASRKTGSQRCTAGYAAMSPARCSALRRAPRRSGSFVSFRPLQREAIA